jgi:hypothetical protein
MCGFCFCVVLYAVGVLRALRRAEVRRHDAALESALRAHAAALGEAKRSRENAERANSAGARGLTLQQAEGWQARAAAMENEINFHRRMSGLYCFDVDELEALLASRRCLRKQRLVTDCWFCFANFGFCVHWQTTQNE